MAIHKLTLCHARSFAVKCTPPIGYFSLSLSRIRNKKYAANVNVGDSILKVNAKMVTPKHLSKALLKIGRMDFEKQSVEYTLESCIKQMPQAIDDLNLSLVTSVILKLGLNSPSLLNILVPYCFKVKEFDRRVAIAHMLSMIIANDVNPEETSKCIKALVTSVAQDVPLHPQYINFKNLGRLCESLTTLDLYSEEFGKVLQWLLEDEFNTRGVAIETCNIASIALYLGKMGLGTPEDWRHWQAAVMNNTLNQSSKTRDLVKFLQAFMHRQIYSKELLGDMGDVLSCRAHELLPNQAFILANVYRTFGFWHQQLFKNIVEAMEHLLMSRHKLNAIDVMETCYWLHSNGLDIPKRTLNVIGKILATNRLHFNSFEAQAIATTTNALGIHNPVFTNSGSSTRQLE